jgi:photosystem II stability/assembly factor-like uncharacterized protein/5-hydroxyisourate hydrolase-like protein (transthyretin family)
MLLRRLEEGRFVRKIRQMLGVAALASLLLWALPVSAGVNQWTSNGPYGGVVRAVAIDPVTPTTLYAGSYGGGLFKSSDDGGSWRRLNAGLTYTDVTSIAINPTTSTKLFAGVYGAGVIKSTDGGSNWSQVNSGLTNTSIQALAIDPTTTTTLYAGTYGGGVFKSTDDGASWNQINSGLANINVLHIAIDPMTTSTLYAGTSGGVFKSTNGGGTWSQEYSGLTNTSIQALAIDPTSTTTLYAGTAGAGVFKSTDGGVSWNQINSGLTTTMVMTLAIDPTAPSTIFVGYFNGLLRSTNGGASWNEVYTSHLSAGFNTIAINPATPSTLYAGTYGGGVFKSLDDGATWTDANSGLTSMTINALAIDPAPPTKIYGANYNGGMFFKSTDGGESWNTINPGFQLFAIAVDTATPANIYAGTGDGMFRSTDGGDSWNQINNGITNPIANLITAIAIDPTTPSTIYIGTGLGGAVYKSANGGNSWNQINNGLTTTDVLALTVDPITPSTLYAGTLNNGVFKSTNGGGSWSQVNTGLTSTNVYTIAIDPTSQSTLYAGTDSAGIFKSTNGGGSWSQVNTGLLSSSIRIIVIDPTNPSTLYAGTFTNGVFKTTNGGGSWTQVNTGLLGTNVLALAIAPAASTTLYAGMYGGGVNVMQIVTPPVTTVTPPGGTFTSAQTVSITANKPATIYYTTTGTDPVTSLTRQTYTAPISISTTTSLKFYAVDGAGVVEPVQTAVYTIFDPAYLTLSYGGTAPWFAQSVTTHDGIDAHQSGAITNSQSSWMETSVTGPGVVRFWWKVSSEACCDPLTFTIDGFSNADFRGTIDWQSRAFTVPDGSHALRWTYSTDSSVLTGSNAGWVDQITFEQGSNIDVTPPVTSATPAAGMYASSQGVTLSCADNVGCSETFYCLGSGCSPTTPYSNPITVSTAADLRFYSTDAAGNSEVVKTATFTFDTAPPSTYVSLTAGTYVGSRDVSLYCSDSGMGCNSTYYCLGSGCSPSTPYSSAISITASTDLRYYSTDRAGNGETVKTSNYTITPDITPPTTTPNAPSGTYGPLYVYFSCSDGNGSGCASTLYCLGTGCIPSTTYNSSVHITASTDLRFYSQDRSGNSEGVQTASYVIDQTPPVTTANPPGGSYETAPLVTLSCSDGNGTGCWKTYYCTGENCSPSILYNGPVPINDSAVLRFYSSDNANNNESVVTQTYVNSSQPKTITVPGMRPTIQAAIDAAYNGDTVLVAPGTYVENINFKGKGITVRSSDGPEVTIIDGNKAGSVVSFISGENINSILDGFVIQNGKSDLGSPGFGKGGGIRINYASPTIRNNKIINNTACIGIGVSVSNGSPIVRENLISNNYQSGCSSGRGGGGIFLGNADGSSGGIFNAQIINNVITNNSTSSNGGGLYIESAGPLISGNIIDRNSAGSAGGGIYSPSFISIRAVQNIISNNSAGNGGGIVLPVAESLLLNNTIVNNNATGKGSGIYAAYSNSMAKVVNNIVVGKTGQDAIFSEDCSALNLPQFKNNIVYTPSGKTYGGNCSDQNGQNGNITADPRLSDPTLGYYGLMSDSPAIDAGENTAPSLPTTDLDGAPRLTDGNGDGATVVDMGAYEFDPTHPVAVLQGVPTGFLTTDSLDITVSGTDVVSYRYALDGGTFASTDIAVATPISLTGMANGQHTIVVLGKNALGREQLLLSATTATWVVNLETTNLTFTYGGNLPWFVQTAVSHDGIAYQSGAISNSQSSWMETTVTGPGAVRFWWKVSSQEYFNPLMFSIDGTTQTSISGSVDWQNKAYSIPAGSHTLRWTYSVGAFASVGSNAGWVDQITFEQGSNVDVTPPRTTATPWGNMYGSAQSVALACGDGTGSGCAGTYYCLGNDCTPNTLYSDSITISSATDLRFYSTDIAGNSEVVKTATFTFDTTPPNSYVSLVSGTYTGSRNVSLFCGDSGMGCNGTYYCLGSDCSPSTPYSSQITISSSTDLRYYSTDRGGNSEMVKTSTYTITQDSTPPITTPGYPSGTYGPRYINLSCNDGNGSGCARTYYCLGADCNPTIPYIDSLYIDIPTDLRFFSQDRDGNNEIVKTASYTIDAVPPKTAATPGGGFYSSVQNVTLSCNDGTGTGCATTYYCLGKDCSPTSLYTSPITISASTHLKFYSRDNVNNDEMIQTVRYTIPLTTPSTIYVPSDKTSIQAAIDTANDGDTILVAPGTYMENINFKGKAITVISSGGQDVTILDGNRTGSVATFANGEWNSSVLNGFTIQNGDPTISSLYNGGGVYISNSSPTITNNKIIHNTGCDGLGIYVNNGGAPIIQRNSISNNYRNVCSGGFGGGGIGIVGGGAVQILDNLIADNTVMSGDGGGISINNGGAPLISGNIIRGNSAAGISPCSQGGGINLYGASTALIVQNLIHDNSAGCGGGVFWGPSGTRGAFLINNTIIDNEGERGSGLYNRGYYNDNAHIINNVIVGKANQSAIYSESCYALNLLQFKNNMVFSPFSPAYSGYCPDQNGINGNITTDPLLNGPLFGAFGLRAGSPAIDAGDNSAPSLPATDLNGASRLIDGTGQGLARVDIGAYEFDPDEPRAVLTDPAGATKETSASITVGGTGIVSYRYALDGGPFATGDTPVSTPIDLTGLAEGTHVLAVIGKTVSREQLVSSATVAQWTIDTIPPVTTATSASGTYLTTQSVTLACSDISGSGCAATSYCLGSGCTPDIPYSESIAIDHTTDLRFYSVDIAGNIEDIRTVNYVIQTHVIATNPDALSFGATLLNLPTTKIITISNLGKDTLTIGSAISINGANANLFSVAPGGSNPCSSLSPSIAAGGSCTVAVTFLPVTSGLKTATLHIVSNAENNPVLDISMSGIGSTVAGVTWQQTGGPYGGYIESFAIDPTNSQTVYAGTFGGGIFKTVNGGVNWTTANSGLTSTYISSIAIDPTNSQTVYVGTNGGFSGANGGGLFKSTNGGTSWSAVNSGITASNISSLAIDPNNSQIIYAGTNSGVYKTTDGGTTWSANGGLNSLSVSSIVIDPSNNQTLYAGTSGFYNGTWGAVFKSSNGGTIWSLVYSSVTYTSGAALAIDPTNSQTVYVSIYGVGVSKTTNGGTTWATVNSGLTSTDTRSLAIDPINNQTLYAATRTGIFKTTNGGTTWSSLYSAPVATSTYGLAIDPTNSQTLYVGRYPGGVLKTTNGGSSWAAMNNGLAATSINAISVDPTSSQNVYAGTCESVFKSTNGGTTWTAINNGITNTDIAAIAIDPRDSQHVYIGTWGGGLFKTTNGGDSWTAANSGLTSLDVISLALDPASSQTLYAGTSVHGLFKTTTGGASWSAINTGMTATSVYSIAIDPTNSQTVFAGGYGGVFKSINGGSSWIAINNGMTATYVQALVIDPGNNQTVYVATNVGAFKTTDGGTTWTAINSGLTSTNVYTVAFDPANSQTIYAGTIGGGVFISVDGGTTWSAINSGLPYRDVVSLAVDPTNSQIVYAGMVGGGIFRTITNVIAGKVTQNGSGLAGVTFSGAPCTTTDSSGAYSCSVAQGWSGTIAPTLAGTAFTPASRSYSGVVTNQTAQEYTAITPPVATTGAASAISATGATLSGTVDNNGADTTLTFDYGLTTGYGNSVFSGKFFAGNSGTLYTQITGLTCGTTYHFRVVGANSTGTAYGLDQSFTTVACPVNGGSIVGTVTDKNTAAGIQNVYVAAYNAVTGLWASSDYTDSYGAYSITGLASGEYKLQFRNQSNFNYLDQWYSSKADKASATAISVTVPGTTSGINVALLKGGSITGTVTDSVSGAAIPGVYVTAVDASTGEWINSATTDSSGVYSIVGLAGSYKLRFSANGYVEQWSGDKADQTAATSVTVTAPNATAGINMAMVKGGNISGIITDSTTEAVILGAYIDAYNTVTGSWVNSGYSDSSGAYSISGLASGNYKLRFSATGYVAQWSGGKSDQAAATTVSVTAPNITAGINLGLAKGAAIAGTVTDSDTGAVIPRVSVTAYNAATGSWVSSVSYGYTNSSGTYRISGLATGSYKLRFAANGYVEQWFGGQADQTAATTVTATAPNTTAGINVALVKGGSISGTISDRTTGAGIAGTYLYVINRSTGDWAGSTQTDSNGSYTITGLASGSYRLRIDPASSTGYIGNWYGGTNDYPCAGAISVNAPNATTGIDAQLDLGGSISGRVTDAATGAGIAGVSISLTNTSSQTGMTSTNVTVNSTGAYTIGGLPSGDYSLTFSARDYISTTSAVTATVTAPASIAGIDATLVKGGGISGRVTDSTTGEGVEGVLLEAVDSLTRGWIGSSTSDDNGDYAITGLPSGSYALYYDGRYARGSYGSGWNSLQSTSSTITAKVLASPVVVTPGVHVVAPLPVIYPAPSSSPAFPPSLAYPAPPAQPVSVVAPAITTGIDIGIDRMGAIAGRVSDSVSDGPLDWISVTAHDSVTGAWVGSTITNSDGTYTISGLPSGNYRIRFASANSANGDYPSTWYGSGVTSEVAVQAPETTSGIDARLDRGGAIAGSITVNSCPGPQQVNIRVYDATGGSLVAETWADTNYTERFSIGALPAGSYKLSINPGEAGFVRQWYPNKTDAASAEPLTVTAGATTGGIEVALAAGGGSISGKVSGSTDNPYVFAPVKLYDWYSGGLVAESWTNPDGSYLLTGLPDASYKLLFTLHQLDRWYRTAGETAEASPVVVSGGGAVTGIDLSELLPVNGVCGKAHGTGQRTEPSTELCTVGTATSVSGTGPWSWTCTGSYGGTTATCATSQTSSGQFPYGIVNTAPGKTAPDITDAIAILYHSAGGAQLTSAQAANADVAPFGSDGKPLGNGVVDIADVIMILRRVVGIGNW